MSGWSSGAEPPYGSEPGPYGNYQPYGNVPPPAPTDGLSIAAFVCSLTCCAGPVGIGLGIAGILRTKRGVRRGRWAAVAGVVIGTIATLSMVAFAVFAGVMGSRTVWEDEARVGQCLNLSFLDDRVKAECSDPHIGEVIWVGDFDEELVDIFDTVSVTDFCAGLTGLDPAYRDAIESGDYDAEISIDAFDEDDPDPGDDFYCYVQRSDGDKFEGKVTETGTTGA